MIILRGVSAQQGVSIATVAWSTGLADVEVPLQSEEAASLLAELARQAPEYGRGVGAGSILNAPQARHAAGLGASFIVSPGLSLDVAHECEARGLPYLPGVMTPTDIQSAIEAGLNRLKLFPASVIGPDGLAALRGPFPQVEFVAVGGVNRSNLGQYLRAGAAGIGVGASVADTQSVLELVTEMAEFTP